jgi:hypothetical protein
MIGAWNPEGKGFLELEDKAFAQLKVREYWKNIASSAIAGVILQTLQFYIINGHELLDARDMQDMSLILLVANAFTLVAALPIKFLVAKPPAKNE